MNSYESMEMMVRVHYQELEREVAMELLAAQANASRPKLRERLAVWLRAFAQRVDPGCQPALAAGRSNT